MCRGRDIPYLEGGKSFSYLFSFWWEGLKSSSQTMAKGPTAKGMQTKEEQILRPWEKVVISVWDIFLVPIGDVSRV